MVRNLVKFGKYKDKTFQWVWDNDNPFFKVIKKLYWKQYSANEKNSYRQVTNKTLVKTTISKDLETVLTLLRARKNSMQIKTALLETVNEQAALNLIVEANKILKKEFDEERRNLVDTHIVRYDKIFEEHINFKLDDSTPANYKRSILCYHKTVAMDTLFQKERLLGVHSKKFKLFINKNIKLDKKIADYDLSKLSFEEKIELLALLKKSRTSLNELKFQEQQKDNKSDEDILDVVYTTIDTKIEVPIKDVKETDIIGDRERKYIEEAGKTVEDITSQLYNKSIKDKLKEMYDKKKNKNK